MTELNFHDNNAIPGMAHMASKFLQVIKQRADEAQIGLDFQPKKERKSNEVHLEATIRFKSMFMSGYPIRVKVHSTPRGSLLHVGYMVTTDEANSFARNINWGAQMEDAARYNMNLRPENQRELSIVMDSFSQAVYFPTVQNLLDAAEAARRPQGGGGFLGSS